MASVTSQLARFERRIEAIIVNLPPSAGGSVARELGELKEDIADMRTGMSGDAESFLAKLSPEERKALLDRFDRKESSVNVRRTGDAMDADGGEFDIDSI